MKFIETKRISMSCEEVAKILKEPFKELSENQKIAVIRHTENCDNCAEQHKSVLDELLKVK
jgi:hypothetical protein